MAILAVLHYVGFSGSVALMGSSNFANSLFQRSGNGSRTGPR
jgi:hypothetical protein